MNISTVKGVRIEAVAACVPTNKIDNRQYAAETFSNDCSSIISAIGINERHVVVKDDTSTIDLCVEAARIALNDVDKKDIGAVIVVTTTPDNILPNCATAAQYLLDLPNDIVAMDINHTCPGYVYGLWTAALMCKSLNKKVLLLDGDVNSKTVSQYDYDTALLYGDAATATIISPDDAADEWHFCFYSDGEGRKSLYIPLGYRSFPKADDFKYETLENGGRRRGVDMVMDAQATIDFELQTMPGYVLGFMEELETEADEYDKLILNQSNFFLMRKFAKMLGFDWKTQMPKTLDRFGNTTSCSVPLTIASELKDREVGKTLVVAQGAGHAAGIADISLSRLKNHGITFVNL